MKTKSFLSAALVAVAALTLAASDAAAQLQWRVSVKFILDANGNRPASGFINTDAAVNSQMTTANQILDGMGRGYRYELAEIVNVPGISQWFNVPPNTSNRDSLDAAAKANKALYHWRDDAINFYISGAAGSFGGYCSFPDDLADLIMVGQNSYSDVLFHESGHFFNLYHTHQGANSCASCGSCSIIPGDGDFIADTLPDHPCYNRDGIAQNSYGAPYNSLAAGQKKLVDNTWLNIMSYHSPGSLITSDQMDRATDAANGDRFNVTSGRTRFVDRTNVGAQSGSSTAPFVTVNGGINAAATNDIVLIRPGNYNESMIISKPLVLRASRGDAVIGLP